MKIWCKNCNNKDICKYYSNIEEINALITDTHDGLPKFIEINMNCSKMTPININPFL